MTEDLQPHEVEAITQRKKPAAQAAELARRGIAYVFTGRSVKVRREVAVAFDLMPQPSVRGIDFGKVR